MDLGRLRDCAYQSELGGRKTTNAASNGRCGVIVCTTIVYVVDFSQLYYAMYNIDNIGFFVICVQLDIAISWKTLFTLISWAFLMFLSCELRVVPKYTYTFFNKQTFDDLFFAFPFRIWLAIPCSEFQYNERRWDEDNFCKIYFCVAFLPMLFTLYFWLYIWNNIP